MFGPNLSSFTIVFELYFVYFLISFFDRKQIFCNLLILQTGGSAFGEISTKSSPRFLEMFKASSIEQF